MQKKTKIILLCIILIVLLPVWMLLAWYLSPKTKFVGAIIDKTVLTPEGQEHSSLTWILRHEKYAKNSTDLYTADYDYFGFFPRDSQKYRLKGLERFTDYQLQQLSNDADFAYVTDAYGIYSNEWYAKKGIGERSAMIYGGMSQQDVDFLGHMKKKKKLIITEFNTIGSPTSDHVRYQFENMFSMKWTEWVGRYFESLDTNVNLEIPKWLINNYKRDNNGKWPFKKSGVAFVNTSDHVVILETGTDLKQELPIIISNDYATEHFGMPKKLSYPFWFDVVTTDTNVNKVIAQFEFGLTKKGKTLLQKNNLPLVFPAVQMHVGDDYQFYYFSADFADNPITMRTAYFKGIEYLNFFMYNKSSESDRGKFFWKLYRPLVTQIFEDYRKTMKH